MLGAAVSKYRLFQLARSVVNEAMLGSTRPKEVLSRQYSLDPEKLTLDREIDTALLPLKIRGIRISEHYSTPKVGGAITTLGNTVIVLDRLGNIYSYEPHSGNLKKLLFPELPNNISDYLSQPNAIVDDKRFRAYSIKFLNSAKLLAVSHEYFDKQYKKSRLAISVIHIDEKALQPTDTWKTIFLGDVEPDGPNEEGGGILAVRGRDKIFLSVGDYGIVDPAVSQDPNSRLGKILELDVDTQNVKTLSLGHRNPEGLVITTGGTLLSTEHGPAGGDELNVVVEGANYGWPIVTLGTGYNSYSWRNTKITGSHAGYQSPIFAWVPSIAVSNLIEVQGFDQRWDGDLLVASLKAQSLFRLRLNKDSILYSEPIWIGQRIRDIAQLQDGTIVFWTDDTALQFISIDRPWLEQNKRNPTFTSSVLSTNCMYCHHWGPTNESDFAPSLTNVIGRKIGSDNFRYSGALRTKEGVWTEKLLREFISNPSQFADGTTMPNLHLDSDELDKILLDLRTAQAPVREMSK